MIVLGIDTALEDVSVGLLLAGGGTVVERSFPHERDALRRLTPLIRDVLREGGVRPQDLDVVACTRGPGSFTGIRVGVAAARALADACGARMSGVSTLRALCMAAEADEGVARLALIRCRPGEVYAGLYRQHASGVWEPVLPDAALPVPALEGWLSGAGLSGPVDVVGPAAETAAAARAATDRLGATSRPGSDIAPVNGGLADAPVAGGAAFRIRTDIARVRVRDLLQAALHDARSRRLLDPMDLIPEYLRPSQAEIRASRRPD